MGRRQGRRLRARGRRRRSGGASRPASRRCASPRSAKALELRPHARLRRASSCSARRRQTSSPLRATQGSSSRVVAAGPQPEGLPLHLKLDTGMGRWGLSELVAPGRSVVGLMTPLRLVGDRSGVHAPAARAVPARRRRRTRTSSGTSRTARRRFAFPRRGSTPSAAASRSTASTRSAPDARVDGLRPVLRWESEVARVVDARARGEHRVRPSLRRRRARPASASSRWATPTDSPAT